MKTINNYNNDIFNNHTAATPIFIVYFYIYLKKCLVVTFIVTYFKLMLFNNCYVPFQNVLLLQYTQAYCKV